MILIIDETPVIANSLRELLDADDIPAIAASTREEVEDAIRRLAAVIHVTVEDIPAYLPTVRQNDSMLVLTPHDEIIRSGLPAVSRIFMSASPSRQLPHVISAGFRGLAKPFEYHELVTTLQSVDTEMALLYTRSIPFEDERVEAQIVGVNDMFLRHLADHPEDLRKLSSRRFEELVAELLSRSGFAVQLQKRSRDGGIDVVATKHELFGDMLLLVQCKHTSRPVGVEVVRQLHGVVVQKRATMGMVATTSAFTRDARRFQQPIFTTLTLRDGNDVLAWLRG